MNLFERQEKANRERVLPLAARMRPRTLEEYVGQSHFLGPGKLLRRMLQARRLQSVIFYGPPGCGKTSLARIISRHIDAQFIQLNATMIGVKELRAALDEARELLETSGRKTVLFLDELHRFNRSQQDALLPDVENGVISLIGATTQNPFFSLVAPLISRSQVFEFKPLTREEIVQLLKSALSDPERGLGSEAVNATDEALDFLADVSDGDARRALNAVEIGAMSLTAAPKMLDLDVAQESIQKKAIQYDRDGDDHFDAASALIKSIRGSDPDAAVYWLARMLEAGEDPRFLARRIVIAASEDVGNADPQALVLAQSVAGGVEFIGLPEGRILLAQAVTYLACAPKSNAAYLAIDAALNDVRTQGVIPVPMHLRDSHYPGAKRLGHGEGYQYAHNSEEGWVDQDYLGVERRYYEPTDRGHEAGFKERLDDLRNRRRPPK
jgi:putative ATPase